MNINSDINILGGLPDFNLIKIFVSESVKSLDQGSGHHSYTAISTAKAVKRFERAIRRTLIRFKCIEVEQLIISILNTESISGNSLLALFWNASVNNDLLTYLNERVFFPAFFTGRIGIGQNEPLACLQELKETNKILKAWSDSTLDRTGSKYLTLLKKFGLMEGTKSKTILHPYLSDQMLMVFIYWLLTVETKSNLLESKWLKYSFLERPVLIERIMQKKFTQFIDIKFSGDTLKIEPSLPYNEIYDALT